MRLHQCLLLTFARGTAAIKEVTQYISAKALRVKEERKGACLAVGQSNIRGSRKICRFQMSKQHFASINKPIMADHGLDTSKYQRSHHQSWRSPAASQYYSVLPDGSVGEGAC